MKIVIDEIPQGIYIKKITVDLEVSNETFTNSSVNAKVSGSVNAKVSDDNTVPSEQIERSEPSFENRPAKEVPAEMNLEF